MSVSFLLVAEDNHLFLLNKNEGHVLSVGCHRMGKLKLKFLFSSMILEQLVKGTLKRACN